MMWKVILMLFLTQSTLAKNNKLLQETTARKVKKFINDATDFITDILYDMSILIGLEKSPKAKKSWSIDNVLKYTFTIIKSSYNLIMARGNTVSFQNINIAGIIEHILTQNNIQ